MFRRIAVAAASLIAGGGVTATLLLQVPTAHPTGQFLVVAHDLPAGAQLGGGALRTETAGLGPAVELAVPAGSLNAEMRAARDLPAGTLLQRGDVAAPASAVARRTVALPLKDLPPVDPGSRVDLLTVAGSAERPDVRVFLQGVEVRAISNGILVVAVTPSQAAAVIYALISTRLVAVAAEGPPLQVPAITTLEEAREAARR